MRFFVLIFLLNNQLVKIILENKKYFYFVILKTINFVFHFSKTKMYSSILNIKKQLNQFIQVVFVLNVPAPIFVCNQNNRFTLRR